MKLAKFRLKKYKNKNKSTTSKPSNEKIRWRWGLCFYNNKKRMAMGIQAKVAARHKQGNRKMFGENDTVRYKCRV